MSWIWTGLMSWEEARAEEEMEWPAGEQAAGLAQLVSRIAVLIMGCGRC